MGFLGPKSGGRVDVICRVSSLIPRGFPDVVIFRYRRASHYPFAYASGISYSARRGRSMYSEYIMHIAGFMLLLTRHLAYSMYRSLDEILF